MFDLPMQRFLSRLVHAAERNAVSQLRMCTLVFATPYRVYRASSFPRGMGFGSCHPRFSFAPALVTKLRIRFGVCGVKERASCYGLSRPRRTRHTPFLPAPTGRSDAARVRGVDFGGFIVIDGNASQSARYLGMGKHA